MTFTTIKEMTDDDVEDMMAEYELKTRSLGFISPDAYEDFKYHAIEGLLRFGGGFAKSLGVTLLHADLNNAAKIITTWFSLLEEHSILHKIWIAKRDAGKVPGDL